MIFPPPDATYSQIQEWRRARSGDPTKDWPQCAACSKRTRAGALVVRTRIRFSAKYKDAVFEPGQVLCAGHQTEPVV